MADAAILKADKER